MAHHTRETHYVTEMRGRLRDPNVMEEAGESAGSEVGKERESEASKRMLADKDFVSNPKKRRLDSSEDNLQRKSHGRSHRDKGKGKHGSRPRGIPQGLKFRHGGSISDPLNLQGMDGLISECSTCNPSPVATPPVQSPPTAPTAASEYQSTDPLNLTAAVKSELKKKGRKEKHRPRSKKQRLPSKSASEGAAPLDDIAPVDDSMKSSVSETASATTRPQKREKSKKRKDAARFCYGNYNRYYGYRNRGVMERDPRLSVIPPELIKGKDVLDVGCNTGQITIVAARDFSPRSITGIDIDGHLITVAQKNILRALPAPKIEGKPIKFPLSIVQIYGPLAALPGGSDEAMSSSESEEGFPHNIHFYQENYVPMSDDELKGIAPSFDTILCLSLTKWLHLNWGDAGLKRSFRKMYRQLRPGGVLILEAQDFKSYDRRKKLTPDIQRNYQNMNFFPHQFRNYLLSVEVGFTRYVRLGMPENTTKGFERPVEAFFKEERPPGTSGRTGPPTGEGAEGKVNPDTGTGESSTEADSSSSDSNPYPDSSSSSSSEDEE